MKTVFVVTLSPALDVHYHVASAEFGLMRASSHSLTAGGKGINLVREIAKILRDSDNTEKDGGEAGFTVENIYPAGGNTGALLESILDGENFPNAVKNHPFPNNAPVRVNASVLPESGRGFEVNAPGADAADAAEKIRAYVAENIKSGDVLCVCGSVPRDVDKAYPANLCRTAREKGAYAVLDCDGDALRIAAEADEKHAASLIKPNIDELEELTGIRPASDEMTVYLAGTLPFETVAVTMGKDGGIVCEKRAGEAPEGIKFTSDPVENPARTKGAGDTYLGAFVYAKYIGGEETPRAAKFASAEAEEYVRGM